MIRRLRQSAEAPSLDEVFARKPTLHGTVGSYASAWAVVAFLARCPRYQEVFAVTEQQPLDADFTRRLTTQPGWNGATASRDFDAFTADLDYGFDCSRMTINWSSGRRLPAAGATATVTAARGWQNSGWQLEAGRQYQAAEHRAAAGLASYTTMIVCLIWRAPQGVSQSTGIAVGHWDVSFSPSGMKNQTQAVEPNFRFLVRAGKRPSQRSAIAHCF